MPRNGGIECFQAFYLSQHVREKYVMAPVTAYFASENSLTVCGLHMELLGDLMRRPSCPAEPEDDLKRPVPIRTDHLMNKHVVTRPLNLYTNRNVVVVVGRGGGGGGDNNLCILW